MGEDQWVFHFKTENQSRPDLRLMKNAKVFRARLRNVVNEMPKDWVKYKNFAAGGEEWLENERFIKVIPDGPRTEFTGIVASKRFQELIGNPIDVPQPTRQTTRAQRSATRREARAQKRRGTTADTADVVAANLRAEGPGASGEAEELGATLQGEGHPAQQERYEAEGSGAVSRG